MKTLSMFSKMTYLVDLFRRYHNKLSLFSHVVFHAPLLQLRTVGGPVFFGNQNSQLLPIVQEIFFSKVYEYGPVRVEKGDVVVDIGGNVGIMSIYAALCGAKHVYVYEPFPDNVVQIKKNIRANNIRNVTVTEAAVSGKNGTQELYIGSVDSGNLLFNHNIQGQLSQSISVQTITLSEIVKQVGYIDMLKIDCEGSEGEIFQSTKKGIWKHIEKIVLEFHDNVSVLDHHELESYLQEVGFATHLYYDGKTPFGYLFGWKTSTQR